MSASLNHAPSTFQQAIFDFVQNGHGNGVVAAGPGSGKTWVIEKACGVVPPGSNVLCVAFSKKIAQAMEERVPQHVQCSTLHSLGLRICNRTLGRTVIEDNKLRLILNGIVANHGRFHHDVPLLSGTLEERQKFLQSYAYTIVRIASLCKMRAIINEPTDNDIKELARRYSVDIAANGDTVKVLGLIRAVLSASRESVDVVDFADMLYMPIAHDMPLPGFDFVFVDECQDLSPTQIELVYRLAEHGARIICVGDRRQAIFGFAGADTASVDTLRDRLGATEMPLSICYRSAKSIVLEAQKIYPDIYPAPDAIDGIVRTTPHAKLHEQVAVGDFVICRTTAPLVKECLASLRGGKRAIVVGRNIGDAIAAMAKKIDQKAEGATYGDKVNAYHAAEVARINGALAGEDHQSEREAALEDLGDRIDTIRALMDASGTLAGLLSSIAKLFEDVNPGDAAKLPRIQYMTAHRSKGLEANRVFIIHPNKMPLRSAKTEEDRTQEKNLKFVAITRARVELVWVSPPLRY